MELDVSEVDGATVIRPDGDRLDGAVAGEFRMALLHLVKDGRSNLVVDLGGISFIDSSGLGALISALKMLRTGKDRRKGARPDPSRRPTVRGDVRLANVQPPVATLLEIIRLNRVFTSYLSVEEAVASYSG